MGHPRPSETGRDNSDHIPIMFVDSGTLVAVLVTDPDVPRTRAAPPERPAADYLGSSQIMDFEGLPRIFKDFAGFLKIMLFVMLRSVRRRGAGPRDVGIGHQDRHKRSRVDKYDRNVIRVVPTSL